MVMMVPNRRLISHGKSLDPGWHFVNRPNPSPSTGYVLPSARLILENSWVSR